MRRLSRRGLLKTGAAATALVLTSPLVNARESVASMESVTGVPGIHFTPIPPQPVTQNHVVVAEGHEQSVLLRWGDPVVPGTPHDWNELNQSPERQDLQFGYNCDYIGWHILPWGQKSSQRGLLWVNHEYTNEELMFPGYDPDNPTEDQVNIGIAAHGGSIVELQRDQHGQMQVMWNSSYNRRITGTTPMQVTGPAADHPWMTTQWDQNTQTVLGMLNNCAGGITPWGTVLTCEENFHQYFGNLSHLSEEDPRYAVHDRYGLPGEASDRKWERFHGRYDIGIEPNESFRFGWVVEIDPYNPASIPVKRTGLGRFRHEGATWGYSPSGRVAFYSGDDSRFEYVYKWVSDEAYEPLKRGMAQSLLDDGTLYVARFNDDGSGDWMPLRYGEGPLTEENGFTSQGDVLIKTRLAADELGATRMDRPEDIQQNPVNKKVYVALTNNTNREADDTDQANPRPDNQFGHIIELTEDGDDAASETFTWEIFVLCGDPEDESTYFAGFPKENVSPVANPDNLNFDMAGNLWISTDGAPRSLEMADGLHVVPTEGPQRGNLQHFLSVVEGAECASFDFTHDNLNLFVAVQHPAEGSDLGQGGPQWPDGGNLPRPSVIQVWATNGGKVGQH